jgi:tRNA (mo5U34)-methyltransferase
VEGPSTIPRRPRPKQRPFEAQRVAVWSRQWLVALIIIRLTVPLFKRAAALPSQASGPAQASDPERERRRKLADEYQTAHGWWHSIDLGKGVVTTGYKSAEHLGDELVAMGFPDVRGKSVLDIGAWDGFYSYEAERRGAARVVALDHFVWCLDTPAQHGYVEQCRRQGVKPLPYETVPEIWRPDDLPGKRGFDLAHDVLESKVEAVVADFMSTDLVKLGSFDVVLFLGVLYHLKDPIGALERLRRLVRGVAVIETEAMEVPGCPGFELWESYSSDQLQGDVTNWWAPNCAGLVGMCKAVGFRDVLVTRGPEPIAASARGPQHYRLFLHALV